LFWVSYFPFYTAFYLCKAALLAVYYVLFPTFMKKRRMALWAVIIYTAVSYVITMILNLSVCTPITTNWALDPGDSCIPNVSTILFQVSWCLHFTSDIMRKFSLASISLSTYASDHEGYSILAPFPDHPQVADEEGS
jgi:hypothetical protein